jgi:hypothetical protein
MHKGGDHAAIVAVHGIAAAEASYAENLANPQ